MTEPIEGLHGLVLAAGGSTRLGRDKQSLEIGGVSVLKIALRRCIAVCGSGFTVVLGANREVYAAEAEGMGVTVAENPEWRQGLSTSIRAGLRAVPDQAAAVLIVLVDQVNVTENALRRLGMAWKRSSGNIAASRYNSTLGAPSVFPRRFFAELEKLSGDKGAKHVILEHPKSVLAVDVPEAADDIDTPEDLARILQMNRG